jgi:hypothetical protein
MAIIQNYLLKSVFYNSKRFRKNIALIAALIGFIVFVEIIPDTTELTP